MRGRILIGFLFGMFFTIGIFLGSSVFAQAEAQGETIFVHHEVPLTIEISGTNRLDLPTSMTFTLIIDYQAALSDTGFLTDTTTVAQVMGNPQSISIVIGSVVTTDTLTQTKQAEAVDISLRTGTILKDANLRAAPSTSSEIVGKAESNDTVEIISENADGTWLQLKDGSWIASFLITEGAASQETNFDTPAIEPVSTPYPLTLVEQRYFNDVQQIFTAYVSVARDNQNTLQSAEQNPDLLSDEAWLNELSGYALVIGVYSKELSELIPSTRLQDAHAELLTGLTFIEAANDIILLERSNNLTADMYNRTRSNLKSGSQHISNALTMMQELKNSADESN